ncbi:unnamed protein product [Pleuronectes platessa]|uniref:Uncharacterized protein n=1 Tax=Pleuronectes platessa TaxID=8262 RepID=A0A9N7TM55_PLEPL|nr:unnamed protein product [Pleuronectes platessa]
MKWNYRHRRRGGGVEVFHGEVGTNRVTAELEDGGDVVERGLLVVQEWVEPQIPQNQTLCSPCTPHPFHVPTCEVCVCRHAPAVSGADIPLISRQAERRGRISPSWDDADLNQIGRDWVPGPGPMWGALHNRALLSGTGVAAGRSPVRTGRHGVMVKQGAVEKGSQGMYTL